jgi:hypothetical protein
VASLNANKNSRKNIKFSPKKEGGMKTTREIEAQIIPILFS